MIAVGMIWIFGTLGLARRDQRAMRRRPIPWSPTRAADAPRLAHSGQADVTLLRFAIDGVVRNRHRHEIAAIEDQSRVLTAEARTTCLREIARLLRTMRHGWRYVGAVNEPIRDHDRGLARFRELADDAHTRFGGVRQVAGVPPYDRMPDALADPYRSPGFVSPTDELVVVTIVVAAAHELFTVDIGDAEDMRKALESLSTEVATEILALEIIWLPASDDVLDESDVVDAYPPPDLVPLR